MKNKEKIDLNKISTLTLSFLGDGVYDLFVREYLISKGDKHVGELNNEKVNLVNCKAQAESAKKLLDYLSEEELDIYKRGRNAKVNSVSKHSTIADYHSATGLECLFGYLYLQNKTDRIKELFLLTVE